MTQSCVKKRNCKTIPTLQVNVTSFAVDTDGEIQKIEHQLSTDNCQTADKENKSESFATVD